MSIKHWLFVIGLLACGSVAAQSASTAVAAPADQAASKTPAPQPPSDANANPAAEAKRAADAKLAEAARLAAAAKLAADARLAAPALQSTSCPPKTRLQDVTVESVAAMSRNELSGGAPPKAVLAPARPTVQLRQGISVTVHGLNTLLEHAQCANKNVVLFLDGRQMTDLTPNPKSDPERNTLFFELKRTEVSRDVWTYLLGKPRFTPRPVEVSVGLVDSYAMPGAGGTGRMVMLDVIHKGWLTIWAGVILFLLFCGLRLGSMSDMLRDSGPPPATGQRKSFSLARVQLATWTFLILASYLFIGLITGDYTTSITDSVLALMGISAGTAIGSSLIDNNPSRLPVGAAAVAVTATPTTGRWWKDILMDEEGVNFHRFQMVAWTLVLGIVFVRQVYNDLAMPEFNPALLALIGISSGTYLGLKITAEKPAVA
jgi:hypothetical protein